MNEAAPDTPDYARLLAGQFAPRRPRRLRRRAATAVSARPSPGAWRCRREGRGRRAASEARRKHWPTPAGGRPRRRRRGRWTRTQRPSIAPPSMRSPRASARSTSSSTASACSARSALADVTEAAFDEVRALNLKAAMFLAQAVARHQVAARAAAPAGRCTCCRCARSSACAAAATRPTAPPRARW